ncbi:sigma-54-dependent transcriptional regulator [Telmatospirillum siberiense]|uniref:DNA-binding response regulator n=1 Tax=Telmatospirillum siberiense TaxID=382514 RepID=A0A2N3PWE9_9PROT|nr:sigma-54 dependent transcriptional regulator [Telmatospirillum siberiense]PKU24732.1 DNA-binding response regulator [Telmatospirillum siberiense]
MADDRPLVLFVDDEQPVRASVEQWLGLSGFQVYVFDDPRRTLEYVGPDFPGVLLSDVKMPGMDGLDLLRETQSRDADLPVILLTGHGDVAMAVEAMRQGAYDFLEKPFLPERLSESVRRASEKRRLIMENRRLRRQMSNDSGIASRLLGTSAAIESLRRDLAELAKADVNVVIVGETGTGKEMVARCLHDFGPRAGNAFVAINCAAVPETMFEAEFFGSEAGAFTGATGQRIGKLEYAHRGTLFLDEIESMPLVLQAKVLRSLQEKVVERLGSHQSVPADARIVSAAKLDLSAAVRGGGFREDLYYRLNVAELVVPPLRERRSDIPLLFEFFSTEAARRHEREPRALSSSELAALMAHDWPGNVRELKNAAERHALGLGGRLTASQVRQDAPSPGLPLAAQVAGFERQAIETAFEACGGDVQAVVELLDVPRRTLNEKMTRYAIDRRRYLRGE